MKSRLFINAIILIMFVSLLLPAAGLAQGSAPVKVTVEALEFTGLVGDTIKVSFEVTTVGEAVTGLELSASDLVEQGSGRVGILGSDVQIDPASFDLEKSAQRVTVQLNQAPEAGEFTGELIFRAEGEDVLKLPVHAILYATPNVDTDGGSKSISINVISPWNCCKVSVLLWNDHRCAKVDGDSKLLGHTLISLVQDGADPAEVLQVVPLAMRRADAKTLPKDAVAVQDELPLTIPGNGAANLTVGVRGEALEAGEYTGTMLVQVKEQAAPVEIPLTVRVKDGRLVAFILLLVGPIVGFVLKFWDQKGKVMFTASRRVDALQSAIEPGSPYLTDDRRVKIEKMVKEVMRLLQNGAEADKVEAALKLAEGERDQAIADVKAWLDGDVSSLEAELGKPEYEKYTLVKQWQKEVSVIRQNMEEGKFPSLENAQNRLKVLIAEFEDFKKNLEELIERVTSDPISSAGLEQAVMDATTLAEVHKAMGTGGGLGLDDEALGKSFSDIVPYDAWGFYKVKLHALRLGVLVVSYLVALLVGWLAIYEAKVTFGADVQDYVTLFLWSATSTAIGGQSLDLKTIISQVKAEIEGVEKLS